MLGHKNMIYICPSTMIDWRVVRFGMLRLVSPAPRYLGI